MRDFILLQPVTLCVLGITSNFISLQLVTLRVPVISHCYNQNCTLYACYYPDWSVGRILKSKVNSSQGVGPDKLELVSMIVGYDMVWYDLVWFSRIW